MGSLLLLAYAFCACSGAETPAGSLRSTPGVPTTTSNSPVTSSAAVTEANGYVGAQACKVCHADIFAAFAHTHMGRLFLMQPRTDVERLGCETCHGPGKAHVAAGGGKGVGGLITFANDDPTPIERRNAVCLSCHTKGERIFWQGSAHESRDVACTSCHHVMADLSPRHALARPTELETCGTCHVRQRSGQMRLTRHPILEGKMSCTSCHDPHGTVTPALLRESSPNDTCYTCHAEKRGPFLWEHAPVTESCSNCHDPHGTSHEAMLKVTTFRLCQQCHDSSRHPTQPFGRDTGSLKFVMGRQCTTCHVNIHGSNHPSGNNLTR